ncbi:response regulator transcription factor [Paenibacillus sp. VCA1]|uniref:response regulator transcription factor n=1 Tax=Paenibacillus sp. VCA1 TaxID=3039148 RepID=UPI0028710119|nr:response regulator transcription factor [Paenibacillus sp. VCA1]MDR9854111.1 response regulator transcription factor [Paenibacillus sp. VCA1]
MHERLLAVGEFFVQSGFVDALRADGYEIMKASSEYEALRAIGEHTIDLLFLDHADYEGSSLPKFIKALLREQADRPFPIILFENPFHERAVIQGLEAGANDVVPRTVSKEELMARIRNLLRIFRIEEERSRKKVTVRDLSIDPGSRKVVRGGNDIELTVKEFDLLLYLARHANEVCSREDILKHVWDYDFDMGTNVVDVYIRHLRTKMDKGYSRKLIQSVRGVGYIIKEGE